MMNFPQAIAIIGIWIAVAIMAPAMGEITVFIAIFAVVTNGLILLWGKS